MTRNGPGGTVSTVGDGNTAVDLTRDGLGQVVERAHTVAGADVFTDVLTRDALGRITQRVTTSAGGESATTEYAYDPSGQLVEVRRDGSVAERYTYDADGNRTSRRLGDGPTESATYSNGLLVSQGATAYTHDADGFLTPDPPVRQR